MMQAFVLSCLLANMVDIFNAVWDVLSSGYALVIYSAIVFILIGTLILAVMTGDRKPPNIILPDTNHLGNVLHVDASKMKGETDEWEEGDEQKAVQVIQVNGVVGGGSEKEETGEKKRFFKLSEIDEERAKFKREKYDENVSLKNFCESFRSFACANMRLYYDIADIRRFIAGMAVSKLIILQGISGTGKTSLANAFGEFLDNPSTVIPVQPMWKERTDLVGYYNEFTKSFNVTKLLEKMYEANYSKDMYVTVLDEMNIARVEYYFAEFLSLLELPTADKRWLDIITDKWENDPIQLVGGKVKLPDNMWFVGTANNDDSTFSISDKVYDRARILNLDQKCEEFTAPKTKQIHLSAERFMEMVRDAEKEYALTRRNQRRLEKLDKYMIENFGITFGNRIMKQIKTYIPVYVACGGEELEALDDILAKKVMRKLEMQNPVYVRNAAEGFCNRIDELFGQDKMKLCKAVIHRLEKNA